MTIYKECFILKIIKMKGGCVVEYKMYDIVLIDFGNDSLGSEQGGERPAVIIQNDIGNLHSGTTIVIPLTSRIKKLNQPTHTLIRKDDANGLMVDSMALGECVRQVSCKRVKSYYGFIARQTDRDNIKKIYYANMGD